MTAAPGTSAADNGRQRRIALAIAPIVVILLAGIAARTPLATAWPRAALVLLLWIVADTAMLTLIARSADRKPPAAAVLATLAGAAVSIWIGAPAPLRAALLAMPALACATAIPILLHIAAAGTRGTRLLRSPGVPRRERWIAAASALLPPPLVRLAAAELSVLHMALFRWGGPADVPVAARAFAYHRHLTPMCATLLVLSVIEAAVYHLLVSHWSRTAALAMFVLSDVGLVYLVGLIKSFRFRPILMTADAVQVRAGFLLDRTIPLDRIAGVSPVFAGEEVRDPATLNMALLAWPNVMLTLNEPLPRRRLWRQQLPYAKVAFRLDDPEPFVRLLRGRLEGATLSSSS